MLHLHTANQQLSDFDVMCHLILSSMPRIRLAENAIPVIPVRLPRSFL